MLNYTSKNGYNITKGKDFLIDLKFQSHQKRLNSLIEQSGLGKVCSKCGREFPITSKYFYKDCNAKDGLRNDCKQCHKATKRQKYHQNKKCHEDISPAKEEDLISEEYENIIQD